MAEYQPDKDERKEAQQVNHLTKLHRSKIREALKNKDTRYLVWKILCNCGIYESIHPGELADFNLGKREIGLILLDEIQEASPGIYLTMQKEAQGYE
ncbi:MAG: hypothetical protein PVG39_00855 [Desulfobacteraceae bacterium]|jgi:hypothetical protein